MKKITYILALLITGFVNAQAIIVDGQLYGGVGAPGESGEWGSITGTLSDQTDLQSALNLKLNTSSYTAADVLSKLLTVDGSGSGLNADLLRGVHWGNVNTSIISSSEITSGAEITANTGVSGVTRNSGYNGVTINALANAAIQLLSPNTSAGIISFGDPEDNDVGRILYRHSTNVLDFDVSGANRMSLSGSGNLTTTGTVTATQLKLSALNTAPASSGATGTTGEIRIDANYIYICTATNTWKRVAISTW